MKKLKITGCNDCPFKATEYDDFAVGSDYITRCTLANHLEYPESLIDMHDSKKGEFTNNIKTPSWCPIKENSLQIGYKNIEGKP